MRINADRRLAGCLFAGVVAWCLAVPAKADALAASLHGQVVDSGSRAPVSSAQVELIGTDLRTTTDEQGRFVLLQVPPGTYSLTASRVGYTPSVTEQLSVKPGEALELPLEMRRLVSLIEEITVTPGAFSFMEAGSPTRQTMSREDIESVPQLGEDIFRAVNRLPGLSSGDSAHFSIRGGRHDETLILLDGLELYEPYHLKDCNEGAISIVDTQTIDGVELLTGGFPAQYGNKRSGVFNIASRTPESDRARYSAGLSFMNARAMGRGPLWGGKGSWLVSARSGYMDLVFGLIDQNGLPSPRYHDVFAKLLRSLGARHVWTLDALHARDARRCREHRPGPRRRKVVHDPAFDRRGVEQQLLGGSQLMRPGHRRLRTAVTALAFVGFERTQAAAEQGKDARSRLPAAVGRAIDDHRPGAAIHKVEIDKQGGFTIYDIEFEAGQGELDVTADGTVLDVATPIELNDAPEPAAALIRAASRGTAITQLSRSEVRARIERQGPKGRLSALATPEYEYEAELATGDEIEVAADGRIIEAPKSMRKSLAARK